MNESNTNTNVREKIKALGGIIDFGAVVSSPWGIYADGQHALPQELHEMRLIRSYDRTFHPVKLVSARKYEQTKWLVVKRYKILGITVFKKYHKGVLYKFI